MVPDLETARRVACVSDAEAAVLASSERPIVVLASRGALPPAIAPDVGSIGVMLPYTPLHHLLLEAFAALSPLPALVMTSGNAGGEPISLGNREALTRLRHIADLFFVPQSGHPDPCRRLGGAGGIIAGRMLFHRQ